MGLLDSTQIICICISNTSQKKVYRGCVSMRLLRVKVLDRCLSYKHLALWAPSASGLGLCESDLVMTYSTNGLESPHSTNSSEGNGH